MHIAITQVGSIMRNAREAECLSQEALAKKSAVSKRTIAAVETNQRSPSYEVLFRLVHALDISADLIFHPDRTPFTPEQDQCIRELLACGERERKIAIATLRTLLRAMRQDEPEKQD